jgi:hypothetical protein
MALAGSIRCSESDPDPFFVNWISYRQIRRQAASDALDLMQ